MALDRTFINSKLQAVAERMNHEGIEVLKGTIVVGDEKFTYKIKQ